MISSDKTLKDLINTKQAKNEEGETSDKTKSDDRWEKNIILENE